VILSTVEPGGGTGEEAYAHESDEEIVVVLEGRLELWVGSEHYDLGTGDAITYPSRVPHRNANPGPDVARILFCMTPPSY
jgi:mannose-6-phosphate isomerase-like protein (cupin superfamily)